MMTHTGDVYGSVPSESLAATQDCEDRQAAGDKLLVRINLQNKMLTFLNLLTDEC